METEAEVKSPSSLGARTPRRPERANDKFNRLVLQLQLEATHGDLLSTNQFAGSKYTSTFTSVDLTAWLIRTRYCHSKLEACGVGQSLLDANVFHNVAKESGDGRTFDFSSEEVWRLGSRTKPPSSPRNLDTSSKSPLAALTRKRLESMTELSFSASSCPSDTSSQSGLSYLTEDGDDCAIIIESFGQCINDFFKALPGRKPMCSAQDICNWLITHDFCETNTQATIIGERLVVTNLITPVGGKRQRKPFNPLDTEQNYRKGAICKTLSFPASPNGSLEAGSEPGSFRSASTRNRVRRPIVLPTADTTVEDRNKLQDVDSKEFQTLCDKLVEDEEKLFVAKSSGLKWRKRHKTVSAEQIAMWLLTNQFCDSRAQAGQIGENLLKVEIIRPVGGVKGFNPASRQDLFMRGQSKPALSRGASSESFDDLDSTEFDSFSSNRSIGFTPRKAADALLKTTASLAERMAEKRALNENSRSNRSGTSVAGHLKAMRERGIIGENAPRYVPPELTPDVKFHKVVRYFRYDEETGRFEGSTEAPIRIQGSNKIQDFEKISPDMLWLEGHE